MPTQTQKSSDKKTSTKAQNKVSKPSKAVTSNSSHEDIERKRKAPKYSSFKLQKKIPHPKGTLPSATYILRKALKMCWDVRRPLIGIVFVYALLNFVFVRGFSSPLNATLAKQTIEESIGESLEGITAVGALFGAIVNSPTNSGSETAGLYQTILFLVVSLAVIWVYRMHAKGKKVTAKEAYYTGLYPIVPFLLVLLVLFLQLIPAYVGSIIYGIVTTNDIAVSGIEKAIFVIFYASLIMLSLYMVCSSLFALYVVTLPEMKPMQALRSSRQLVFSRRRSIFTKLLLLPVIAFILLIVVLVPFIYFLPVLAPWLYAFLSLSGVVFLHAYLFTLYKELL